MKVNLGNVQSFENVPIGWYQVGVIKAELRENDKKLDGSLRVPYVKTWFEIVDGEHSKHKLFHDFTFTEKAIGFMKPFLVAIGTPQDKEIDVDPDYWVGEQLMVYVNHQIKNGKTREVCEFFASLAEHKKEKVLSGDDIPF